MRPKPDMLATWEPVVTSPSRNDSNLLPCSNLKSQWRRTELRMCTDHLTLFSERETGLIFFFQSWEKKYNDSRIRLVRTKYGYIKVPTDSKFRLGIYLLLFFFIILSFFIYSLVIIWLWSIVINYRMKNYTAPGGFWVQGLGWRFYEMNQANKTLLFFVRFSYHEQE